MQKALWMMCLFCLLTSLAVAQTKMSATIKCEKSSTQQMVPAGDHPDHSFGVTQGNCASTKPWTVAGVAGKDGVGASTIEVNGAKAKARGLYVETMENGDKGFYRFEYTSITKDGQVTVDSHKWQLVGGTGKLKNAKGQGTCTGSGTTEGGVTFECEGEYTSPK